jgi:tetratricopeptide (TPR) repeat protein
MSKNTSFSNLNESKLKRGGIKMKSFNHVPLDAIMLYRKAIENLTRNNHELALKHLSNAVMIAPQFTTALCEMGSCYEKLGRYPEALSKFDKVLQIDPSHVEAEKNKNRILEKMGRKK